MTVTASYSRNGATKTAAQQVRIVDKDVALSSIAIQGPSIVPENGSASYSAIAAYSNGSTQIVTQTSTWSENSPYASISGGTLATASVSGNQTVLVSASFTSGGITRNASVSVTISDSVTTVGSHDGRFSTYSGTSTCISCHSTEAVNFQQSVHYQWQGDASESSGLSSPRAGKLGGINDFCIYPDINWLGKLTNTATCLKCHANAGGGNNFKRGDIEAAHSNPSRDFDVHLASKTQGGAGLSCLSCHTAVSHRIAGRGIDMRERDIPNVVSCSNCHSSAPHGSTAIDKHTARVNCNVCHIPEFAKIAPTDMMRDWSAPGDVNSITRLYEPHMTMQSHVTPAYGFFNGRSQFYEFGAPATPGPNGRVLMAGPLGSVNDAGAKIQAMKRHEGLQPMDLSTKRLLPLKIGIFFQTGNIVTAVAEGAKALGWDSINGHGYASTERYMGLYHEVAPKESALSCSNCHGGTRMDFAALGYAPLATRNGKPLCGSCHSAKTAGFDKTHDIHVTNRKYDCSTCHTFSKATS